MRCFLHIGEQIRIINEPYEFVCSYSQFQLLEPEYPSLPTGKNVRYWTPDMAWLDGDAHAPIDVDCGPYTLKCSEYCNPGPFIYAHVTLSQNSLNIDADPPESIDYEVHLKATTDPEDDDLPIDNDWVMRIRNESDLFYDAFKVVFEDGAAEGIYTYQEGLPLGNYYVKEDDFDQVTITDVTYTVKLVEPLTFSIYRNG